MTGFAFVDESVQGGGYGYGAGTGAAGEGFAGTTFPYTHLECVAVNDFDEFCVDTVRESNVIFEFRTDLFDFEIVNDHPYIRSHVDFPWKHL